MDSNIDKIDFCIKQVKKCTKELMKLSFINYINTERLSSYKISNKNINNINY